MITKQNHTPETPNTILMTFDLGFIFSRTCAENIAGTTAATPPKISPLKNQQ